MADARWHSGRAPTRDETLAELARILRRCREQFSLLTGAALDDAYARADRVQAAHDLVMKLPRDKQDLKL
jgi:hypothetical protein